MFKKIITVFLSALLLLGAAFAHADAKKHIVCSSFPYYDFTMNILGEKAQDFDVEILQDSGMDLHNFQPSAQDFVKLYSADLFIYNGGPSEAWGDEAAKTLKQSNAAAVNLVDSLGDSVKMAEMVEGMEPHEHEHEHDHDHEHEHEHEHDHDHEHEHEHDHDHDHDHEDEHIWLSLKNAKAICEIIAENIIRLDPENEEIYKNSLDSYISKLDSLDNLYNETVENAKLNTLLFADRFPFRYMVDDYKLEYFAAFSGCSAESEASFETVAFLAEKLSELKLPCVIVLDGSTKDIAKAVINAANSSDTKILTLDSMQTISRADIDGSASYLSIMEENLETLKKALN